MLNSGAPDGPAAWLAAVLSPCGPRDPRVRLLLASFALAFERWGRARVTLRELEQQTRIPRSTAGRLLRRGAADGWLERAPHGRSYLYRPAFPAELAEAEP